MKNEELRIKNLFEWRNEVRRPKGKPMKNLFEWRMKNYKKDTTNILMNDWGLKVLDALSLYHNIYHAEE